MSFSVVSVIGARPQFVKSAILSHALRVAGIQEYVVHSGQHYDHDMSGRFLKDLGIEVHHNLEVGSGNHAAQTANIMLGFQAYLNGLPAYPNSIIVYGDTNSTLAASLVASKIGIRIVHVEAGLRSYNREMPEEINRVLTDHLSDMLFCSSEEGRTNLAAEGITERVHVVGDVMYDAFHHYAPQASDTALERILGARADEPFVFMTIHRPSNTDNPAFLPKLCEVARRIDSNIVWPVHPRFRAAVDAAEIPDNVITTSPVGYFEVLALLKHCDHVLTDSGGLQKEAYWAKKRCITLRDETEWVETLNGGWNVLAGLDSNLAALLVREPSTEWNPLYGDGHACSAIAERIAARIEAGDD